MGALTARRRGLPPLARLGGGSAPFLWGALAVVLGSIVVGATAWFVDGWALGPAAALGGALVLAAGVVSGTSVLVSAAAVVQVVALGGTAVATSPAPAPAAALGAGFVVWLAAESGWVSLELRPGPRATSASRLGRVTDVGVLAAAGLGAGAVATWMSAGPGGDPMLLRGAAVLLVLGTVVALWRISRPSG